MKDFTASTEPPLSWNGYVHEVMVGLVVSDSSGSMSSSSPHETRNRGVAISIARMAKENNFFIEFVIY